VGHVAPMREMRNAYRVMIEKDARNRQIEDLETVILERMLVNKFGGCEMDSSGSGLGPMAGSYEHGNERLGSIKGGEFLD